jgi:ADP-ribose pyrophosphatase YjhB (NUDIX family)
VGVLSGWRFCPRCRSELVHGDGEVNCGECGFTYYSNPVPAVAALVVDDRGQVLLARRAVEPDAGLWDTPGGFLDEDEEPLDGLRRELREEAGLEIEPGRFYGIYLDRYGGDDESTAILNLVWEARVADGEPQPSDDVSELAWFSPDALPHDDELSFRWVARVLRDWADGR